MLDLVIKVISDSGGAVWGDRARVRIYSDPFPVAAPPDFSDTSFSPFRTSSCLSLITLGLAGRIGTILPTIFITGRGTGELYQGYEMISPYYNKGV